MTQGSKVVASVIRAAQDFWVGTTPRREPLQWLDALIASSKYDLTMLWRIEEELPWKSVALRERAAVVAAMMVASLRDIGNEAELQRMLSNLGVSGTLQVIGEFRGKPFLQNGLQAVLGMT